MSAPVPSSRREPADPELLSQIAAGDLESLGTLYDRYQEDVSRLLARLGARAADLDDLVQQSFLEVLRAAGNFDGRASARAWLLGIATMILRRNRRSLARMATRLAALVRTTDTPKPVTPAESLEALEARQRAARALAGLSDSKREVFVLVVLEGASGEEAAAALGIPVNTVWTRLHHARRELRAKLLVEPA